MGAGAGRIVLPVFLILDYYHGLFRFFVDVAVAEHECQASENGRPVIMHHPSVAAVMPPVMAPPGERCVRLRQDDHA